MKGKNSTINRKSHAFLFKKNMILLWKKSRMISCNFLMIFCTFLIMVASEVMACVEPLTESLQEESWNGVVYFIFLLPVLIWICLFTLFPIFGGLHRIRERKLKKSMQKVEEATEEKEKSVKT
ncbi:hypothetical protein HNQ69_001606 [Bartonella callosciuri]|uniref:Uncharacterized protein n=1 Tax=Bartonella callosciuri TaxID=686223 RepID=A0A840NX16_9HYPH|nr:hypothetical protein [Bartonella callosciuri]MBB5074463.1 hypothetical protein [Bartonella callosciuri]